MRRFTGKVEEERAALRLVNSHYGKPELCGLSKEAIEQWGAFNKAAPDSVAEALLDLAAVTSSLCECSEDHFDDSDPLVTVNIEEAFALLRSCVGEQSDAADRQKAAAPLPAARKRWSGGRHDRPSE